MHYNEWVAAAGALGFALVTGPNSEARPGVHFRWLARDLPVVTPKPGVMGQPWMFGGWREHRVIVSSTIVPGETVVLVELRPSLPFPCWTPTASFPKHGGVIGEPLREVEAVLLANASSRWIAVSSSAVELRFPGSLDVGALRHEIEVAVSIAKAARAAVPFERHPAVITRFAEHAAIDGLTNDGAGLLLGALSGMSVAVDFQAEPQGAHIVVVASFPRSLGLGLNVFAQRPGFGSFFERLVDMQDIVVGHPLFDDAAVIQGRDANAVRARFDHPELATALSILIKGTETFHISDTSLVARHAFDMDLDDGHVPGKFLDALSIVGETLF